MGDPRAQKRGRGRPSQGGPTVGRFVRMDEPWATAARIAQLRGETMHEVLTVKLGEYVEEHRHLLGEQRAA